MTYRIAYADTFHRTGTLPRPPGLKPVRQPEHVPVHTLGRPQEQRRPRTGEVRRAATQRDGMQGDAILIDQARRRAAPVVNSLPNQAPWL